LSRRRFSTENIVDQREGHKGVKNGRNDSLKQGPCPANRNQRGEISGERRLAKPARSELITKRGVGVLTETAGVRGRNIIVGGQRRG